MMGYHHGKRTYRLSFEGTEFDGLEMRCRGLSIGDRFELQNSRDYEQDLVRLFAESLVEWNMEDEAGEPVPTVAEAWSDEDTDLVLSIATTWLREVSGVRRPLGSRLTNGKVEAGITMTDLPN